MFTFESIVAIMIVVGLGGTATAKYEKYTLGINEHGTRFKETIYVNAEKKIEIFKVPAHNKVVASIVLNDAKRNLTMTHVLKRKACFLRRLDSQRMSSPVDLKYALETAGRYKVKFSKTIIKKDEVLTVRRLESTDILSAEMKKMCKGLPIFWDVAFKSVTEMKAFAISRARNVYLKSKNVKRQFGMQVHCDSNGHTILGQCIARIKAKYPEVTVPFSDRFMSITCKYRGYGSCIYFASCQWVATKGTITCNTVHNYSGFFCCSYKCKVLEKI